MFNDLIKKRNIVEETILSLSDDSVDPNQLFEEFTDEELDFLLEEFCGETLLNESSATTLIKITRQTKIRRLTGGMVMALARAKGDGLYTRYKKLRSKALGVKNKIRRKYIHKARMLARKKIMSGGNKSASVNKKVTKKISDSLVGSEAKTL